MNGEGCVRECRKIMKILGDGKKTNGDVCDILTGVICYYFSDCEEDIKLREKYFEEFIKNTRLTYKMYEEGTKDIKVEM